MIDEQVTPKVPEKVEEPKQTPAPTPVAKEVVKEQVVTKQLSDKDAAVASMIQSQGMFPTVDVVEKHQNLFELPKECKPYHDKYDFRWVSKDTRMMDRAQVKGWRICNSTNTPWIPSYLIAAHGGVDKHGHILAFRPKDLSKAYRLRYQKQSIDAIKAATKDGVKDKESSPFYTAKLSSKEESTDGGAGELVQERDF